MGRRLGSRYVLGEPLGSGAGGEVFRARDVSGAEHAVKVLHAALATDRTTVGRFVAERSVLQEIDSPYVVRVSDLVAEGETLAIVMEYVPGGNLRQLLDATGPLPATEVARLGAGVAAGLAAVHAAGVVHRDIKPENVLVDEGRRPTRPMLTDFGIAHLIAEERLDCTTGLIGTPYYVAPELIAGNPATPASDLYALGILLYELATGTPPFTGPLPAVLGGHAWTTPSRPQGVPEQLWGVMSQLLAKEPGQRITDAAQVAARLRHLTTSLDPSIRIPRPRGYRPEAPAPRRDLLAETVIPAPAPLPVATDALPGTAGSDRRSQAVPRRRRRSLVVVGVAAVIVGGAAVAVLGPLDRHDGRSLPPTASDAAAITKLVRTVDVTADYAHVVCDRSFTADYVATAYGSARTCRHSRDANPLSRPTSVGVTRLETHGDIASATVTEHGGDANGSAGTWYFLRSRGKWRVSGLGIDYVRSNFKLGLVQHRNRGAADPFADPAYRRCFADTLLALPDDQFLAANSATQSGRSYVGTIVAPCDTVTPAGISPFRIAFNTLFRQSLAPRIADCGVNAMQTRISDADLTSALLDPPGSDAVTSLKALNAGAVRGCSAAVAARPAGP